ncbi:MAG: aminoglycoside phosphotransferase family protein [Candidatus Binatia bacterium]
MAASIDQLIAEKVDALFGHNTAITGITALPGDASTRRYYRVYLHGAAPPPSLMAMQLPAGSGLPISSEELAVFKDAPKELPFLNVHRFLDRVGVRVPKIYGQWAADGLLLLEDLGDVALWDRVQGLPESEVIGWYKKAIDELLRLQTAGTENRDEACIAFQQRFDEKLYNWEFEHFIEWGLEKRPGAKISTTALSTLRETFAAIAQRLDRQPPCLNHRDYHSWNLMIHDDAVCVIDFQDALLAPPQYDLASLLNDRITDAVVQPHIEQQLVAYYRERAIELSGRAISRQEFLEIYRLSAIQRDLKVVGRFYYLDLVKGKPGYMKFVPPTVRRLQRNLAQVAQTEKILPQLREHFEAML